MQKIHDLTKDGKLKIVQNTTMNSYTFDSLLLSYFTTINKKTKKIVDLCAGNAPVCMLLTRRLKVDDYFIHAVEIQKAVAILGQKSLELNNLEDKIKILNRDLKRVSEEIGKNRFDLITCNPPYFKVDQDSNLNENSSVAIARHEISVTLEDIIEEARVLLNNEGILSIVFRPERFDELIVCLNKYGFNVKKMLFVYPKKGQNCNTVLVEAKKGKANSQVKILEPLYVYHQDSTYTKEALKIINQ